MILLIDNYDSFVHNLARHFRLLGRETRVVRNDAIDGPEVQELCPEAVVLSPGPCTPAQAGCSIEIVKQLHDKLPLLGICLGHQAIGVALGARLVRANQPVHGRSSLIEHDGLGVFDGLPQSLEVGRYHSLSIDPVTLPAALKPTALTAEGQLMAVRHRDYPVVGLQFHPESVLTQHGLPILRNFLEMCDAARSEPARLPAEAKEMLS